MNFFANITKAFLYIFVNFAITILSAHAYEGQCGVIDTDGNVIIPLEYSRIEDVYGKAQFLAHSIVPDPGKANPMDVKKLFDKNGKPLNLDILRPAHEHAPVPDGYTVEADFYGGFVVGSIVRSDSHHGSKLGFIGSDGRVLMPYEFDVLRIVDDFRMFAMKKEPRGKEEYCLYDTVGHLVAKLPDFAKNFDSAYNEGLLLVGDDKGRGFVDLEGQVVIAPNKYEYDFPFNCGLADVQFEYRGKLSSGYVDKKNKLVAGPFENSKAQEFGPDLGMIRRTSEDGSVKFGAVDKKGRLIFPIEFEELGCYTKRFVFGRRNGKFQLFLPTGELAATLPDGCVSAAAYDFDKNSIVPFNLGPNGNASTSGKWGYCDEHGKVVIEPMFDFAGLFEGDVAVAFIKDKYGDTKMGLLDRKGRWRVPPRYSTATIVGPNRVIVSQEKMNGIERAWHTWGYRSKSLFERTLQFYDLVGMTESELNSILGGGQIQDDAPLVVPEIVHKRIYYDLSPGVRCGNASFGVEFGIDHNGRVWGWRYRAFCEQPASWVSENPKNFTH